MTESLKLCFYQESVSKRAGCGSFKFSGQKRSWNKCILRGTLISNYSPMISLVSRSKLIYCMSIPGLHVIASRFKMSEEAAKIRLFSKRFPPWRPQLSFLRDPPSPEVGNDKPPAMTTSTSPSPFTTLPQAWRRRPFGIRGYFDKKRKEFTFLPCISIYVNGFCTSSVDSPVSTSRRNIESLRNKGVVVPLIKYSSKNIY